ncbi:MAG TPA: FliH/SctL family protein [Anaerolineaceae bacterium]|nr:FliH/SctL family protein [Anaerolineaceae bacterium]
MKSSLNPANNDLSQPRPTAWLPGDFSEAVERNAADVDAIEQIFKADLGATIQAAGRKGVNKANPDLLVSGWQPDDLKFQQFPAQKVGQKKGSFKQSVSSFAAEDRLITQGQKVKEESFILAEAQARAAEIITRAVSVTDEMTQKGYLDGLEKGKVELSSTLEAANNLIEQLHSMEEEILANSESQVLDLVKEIATSMFGEGVVLDGKALHETFTRAFVNARSLGNLKVYLNPKDAINLDPNWREDQVYISGQKMHFIPSEDIKPGGCYVIGEQGSVDARIDTKLASILKVLTHYEEKA